MVDAVENVLIFSPEEIGAGFPQTAPLDRARDLAMQVPLLVDRIGERANELMDSDLHTDRDRVPATIQAQLIVYRTGVALTGLSRLTAAEEAELLQMKS